MSKVPSEVQGKRSKGVEVTMRRSLPILGFLVALVLFAAGCGGGSSSSSSSESASSSGSETTAETETTSDAASESGGGEAAASNLVSEDEAAVKKAEEIPHTWEGPTSSPTPVKGAKVAIISCSQASNCALGVTNIEEAAQGLGWSTSVFDGKGQPSVYNSALHSAVDGGAEGIIDIAIPPPLAQEGLRYAKAHDVPVVNSGETDSTDPLIAGNSPNQWKKQGEQIGKWLVADSEGQAKVVIIRDNEFPGIKERQDLVKQELEACEECKVLEEIPMTITQDTNPTVMQQQTQSILAKHGDELTYIASPFGTVDGLIVPALKAAGKDDVKIVGYDGNEQESTLCHEGAVGAIAVTLSEWVSWGAVDQLNRVMQGEEPVDENVPSFLATEKTCPPGKTAETLVTFPFEKEYEKIWGGE
jgi:ribose transport system substrate-binding protein